MSWHPWPVDRAWPASAAEEVEFLTELVDTGKGRPLKTYDRGHVTVAITALRQGAGVEDVLRWAPGVDPRRLVAALRDLEQRRAAAAAAWGELVDDASAQALISLGPSAARLLPAAVGYLTRVMRSTHGAGVALATAKLAGRVETAGRAVQLIEDRLRNERDPDVARELGRQLWNPHDRCLWQEPFFLPARVGQLSRVRVDGLLAAAGEIDGLGTMLEDDDA